MRLQEGRARAVSCQMKEFILQDAISQTGFEAEQ